MMTDENYMSALDLYKLRELSQMQIERCYYSYFYHKLGVKYLSFFSSQYMSFKPDHTFP